MTARMKIDKIRPAFVESVPDTLEEGVLYISERFRMCSHKCCCGCGEEVITPLSPAEWKLTREGDLVSLWPSVGNWDYACRSHYIIQRNEVLEALPMADWQIARVRQRDVADLGRMVAIRNAAKDIRPGSGVVSPIPSVTTSAQTRSDTTLPNDRRIPRTRWGRLLRRLMGRG